VQAECEQGFSIVGEAPWLNRDDWNAIVVSQDRTRVRLVLLDAKQPLSGAFTRLINGIFRCNLTPAIVEPNELLVRWCYRHNFRHKVIGKGLYRHHIWYPRRDHP
jgi:hypothetical protein